ncbi:MAG TPA: hypothetical protein VGF69_11085 [Thermoanaerobaculia bacterium]
MDQGHLRQQRLDCAAGTPSSCSAPRTSSMFLHPVELPESVRNAARGVMDTLRLVCGSMDLRLTPEGELVFLEVNSGGSFLELQKALNVPIADMLAELLVTRARTVELPDTQPAVLPLAAVVANEVEGADRLFDFEAGLDSMRMAMRMLIPTASAVEIELDARQQEMLLARSGIRASRARLDLHTHVLVPIRE